MSAIIQKLDQAAALIAEARVLAGAPRPPEPPPPPPPPVEPPPPPPGTLPPYNGHIHWDLGSPGEVSPTDTRRYATSGQPYAVRINKTSDGNTLRLQGVSWFSHVRSEIPGVRGEYRGMQMAGYHDIPLAGAPNGPLVVLFTLEGAAGGDIAPQFF